MTANEQRLPCIFHQTLRDAAVLPVPDPVENPAQIYARVARPVRSDSLAQVAAKASADALAQPASAHDPVPIETVLRLLTDVRRIADVMAEFAAGN
jgi:hypothetical protein